MKYNLLRIKIQTEYYNYYYYRYVLVVFEFFIFLFSRFQTICTFYLNIILAKKKEDKSDNLPLLVLQLSTTALLKVPNVKYRVTVKTLFYIYFLITKLFKKKAK